jgi:hypothetical protein
VIFSKKKKRFAAGKMGDIGELESYIKGLLEETFTELATREKDVVAGV